MRQPTDTSGWKLDTTYLNLPETFYTLQSAEPVTDPQIVQFNHELARELGLNGVLDEGEASASILAGNETPPGARPLAQAYGGHQFGHFNMLGDGRAVLLGEQITPDGRRVDLQWKGSGRTPYSRGGDGRAALGPMLREYVISEAMHGLGIPTTRSLAVCTTGEPVYREETLPGAVLLRTAASHLRVGTFQYAAAWGETEDRIALADYAINRHYPHLLQAEKTERYAGLLREVIKRQATLIARWQLVGFVHGVMNTDNMTISGETIDYGPCAFIDIYDPAAVFSSIDRQGRYAYGRQPQIGGWNLARLAEAMLPLFDPDEERAIALAQDELDQYGAQFQIVYEQGMLAKLGLVQDQSEGAGGVNEADRTLVEQLLQLMQTYREDYTNTFSALTQGSVEEGQMWGSPDFQAWKIRWEERLEQTNGGVEAAKASMRRHNPAVIARNHRVEEVLAAAQRDDYDPLTQFLAVLRDPFAYSKEQEAYREPPHSGEAPYVTFCGT